MWPKREEEELEICRSKYMFSSTFVMIDFVKINYSKSKLKK